VKVLVARENEEEKFDEKKINFGEKKMAEKKSRGKLSDLLHGGGLLGTLFYVFLGIGLALVVKQTMVYALSSDMPVVAVVSQSMQHDNPDQTYYSWLEQKMGYTKEYINSWPVPTGFLVGDMPIVQGESDYIVGDIIVYSVPNQEVPIIHRIIKINSDGTYQTKGDNNLNQLPYEFSVSKEQVHGKVLFVIPKLGYFKVLTTKIFGVS